MTAALLCALTLTLAGADEAKAIQVIKPADAAKYVGKRVTVAYIVRSVNQSARAIALLNSEKRFRDEKNFCVVLLRADRRKFEEAQFDNAKVLIQVFLNKPLRATGTISRQGKRLELIVKEYKDIQAAGESAS